MIFSESRVGGIFHIQKSATIFFKKVGCIIKKNELSSLFFGRRVPTFAGVFSRPDATFANMGNAGTHFPLNIIVTLQKKPLTRKMVILTI